MKNTDLVTDYINRAGHRLEAVRLLFQKNSFADVVRESQEVVELCLKALLRASNIEVPRIHDVSAILQDQKSRLPQVIQPQVDHLAKISKSLRRDRELAFYGTEDLTPSDFYNQEDAQKALDGASSVYDLCQSALED
ncbi:MAG: HEPN domain-containing protein [Deltaproteobacteria bacterium]|nr:HEPN domain-containing protein [Deltaproteobacteria bacterium]